MTMTILHRRVGAARPRRRMNWKLETWHVTHVLPEGDVRDHVAAVDCWCRPVAHGWMSGTVHHHRAADGRPEYGREGDLPGAWRLASRFEAEAGRRRGKKGAAP